MYVVICREDEQQGQPGRYVAATRTLFASADSAAKHLTGISARREPRLVSPEEYLRECLSWRNG